MTDIREDAVRDYLAGATIQKIAGHQNSNQKTISKILHEAGVVIRTKSDYDCRKLFCNDLFFESVEDEPQAYWLGFITADGYVRPQRNELEIELQRQDEEHLRSFISAITADARVKQRTTSTSDLSSISIRSANLIRCLERLGIHQKKSLTVQPWSGPDHLMRHYWRGLLDGDGGIFYDIKNHDWSVALSGNLAITTAFEHYVKQILTTKAKPHPSNARKSCYVFGVKGTNLSKSLLDVLYTGSTVSLLRKKLLAETVLKTACLCARCISYKICIHCGKPICTPEGHVRGGLPRRFCSRLCRDRANRTGNAVARS